jgi:hypothetical protein
METGALLGEHEQKLSILRLKEHLNQLVNCCSALHQRTGALLPQEENESCIKVLKSSSLGREAVRVWNQLDWNDLRSVKEAGRFAQTLKLLNSLILDLRGSDSSEYSRMILDDIRNLFPKTENIHIPQLRSWYEESLKPPLTWNIELIDIYLQRSELAKAANTSESLGQWLAPLVIVVEQQHSALLKGISIPLQAAMESPSTLTDLRQKLTDSMQQLNNMLDQLSSPDPDIQLFADVSGLVQNDYEFYYPLSRNWAGTPVSSSLNQIIVNLSLIMFNVETQQSQFSTSQRFSNYYRELLQVTDKYIALLRNVTSDLERLLTPRNLTRIWKGMDIRVEHVVLKTGCDFPAQYAHLLDKYQVETIISDSETRILHEEGDLFVIRVDNLIEEEMPYLTVSMKG